MSDSVKVDARLSSDMRLAFMHFPKTGGTTVHNCLAKLFSQDEICPERFDTISLWPKSLLDRYKFFSAHANLSSFAPISDRARIITFLRDPLERNISLFEYWASYSDAHIETYNLYQPRLAKSLGINEFFSRANRPQCAYLYNAYANSLAGINFSPFGIHHHENPREVAEKAIESLENISFFGISEDLDLSFDRLSSTLDIPNTYAGQRENVTRVNIINLPDAHEAPRLEEVKADTLAALAEATEADQLVYDYAVKRFYADQPRRRRLRGVAGPPAIATVRKGRDSTWVESHGEGFILFGPYVRLRPGRYVVEFRCRKSSSSAPIGTDALGYVDVVANIGQTFLGRSDIHWVDHDGEMLIRLEFETSTVYSDVEFRCFSSSMMPFDIDETTVLYIGLH